MMCRLDVRTLRALNEFFTAKTALRPPDASSVPEGNATHALPLTLTSKEGVIGDSWRKRKD